MLTALSTRVGLMAKHSGYVSSAFHHLPDKTFWNKFCRYYNKKNNGLPTVLPHDTFAKLTVQDVSKLPNVANVKVTKVTTQKAKGEASELSTRTTETITFKPLAKSAPVNVKAPFIAKRPIKHWSLGEIFNKKQIEFYERIRLECLKHPPVKLTAEETAHLVAKNYGTGAAKKGKVLHLVIGPPGSGKSSVVVNPLRDKYGAMVIDSDFIKPQIRGYEKGLGGNAVHGPSAEIASQLLVKAMENGDNIVHPTTGYCEQYILELIKAASDKGYKVGLHLVDLPSREAAKRVLKRAEQEVDGIRQIVDLHYTLNVVGNRPRKVYRHIVSKHSEKIHAHSHHSNKVRHGEKAKLIRKSENDIHHDHHSEPPKTKDDN